MKSLILAEGRQVEGGWVGRAFGKEGVIAIGAGPTEADFESSLRRNTNDYLADFGDGWLRQWQHGGDPAIPNCPEGAVKLPIDLWVCKLKGQTCPIQAQVFVKTPDIFLKECLAPEERKLGILSSVASGAYKGFHHVAGRFLCVRCEEIKGSASTFSYHCPWEVSALEHFAPFDPERDMRRALPILFAAGFSRNALTCLLCASHALELANLLYADEARSLRVLQFNIARPD